MVRSDSKHAKRSTPSLPADFQGLTTDSMNRAFACPHVELDGRAILEVARAGDASWHFLCGEPHESGGTHPVRLEDMLKRDPSLTALSSLEAHDCASRSDPWAKWIKGDLLLLQIPEVIARFGWFVAQVADDLRPQESSFAYSIGMPNTLSHAELLIVGYSAAPMPAIINEVGERLRDGRGWRSGVAVKNLLDQDVLFESRTIHPSWYRDYLGYALWFHEGSTFRVEQLFWSDERGRFPWHADCAPKVRDAQPDLTRPKQ